MVSHKKRRGTAIVVTPKGILVVSSNGKLFMLPGGQAEKGESRQDTAIRELKEETGLHSTSSTFLFEYTSTHYNHKVYLITASGEAKPHSEIRYISYFTGANVPLYYSSRKIIDLYKYATLRNKTRCTYCNAPLELGSSGVMICKYCGQSV